MLNEARLIDSGPPCQNSGCLAFYSTYVKWGNIALRRTQGASPAPGLPRYVQAQRVPRKHPNDSRRSAHPFRGCVKRKSKTWAQKTRRGNEIGCSHWMLCLEGFAGASPRSADLIFAGSKEISGFIVAQC